MPQIKTYGNELWLNAVADNEKYAVSVNPEMVERFCRKLDEYGLNYYAYTTDDFGKIAFNKSDLNLIEQVTAQRIAERVEPFHRRSAVFNRIIGNIGYGKIENKSFLKKNGAA